PTGGDPIYHHKGPTNGRHWRKEHGLEGKFLVLYAGSFHERYGLGAVLEAAQALSASRGDIHWIFAGNGRDRPKVERAAGRWPTVHYLGGVAKDRLLRVYLATDVGLVTVVPRPLTEALIPGKLFDYLAAGMPVISLIGGQSGQIIHAARAGVVLEHADADHLARAVLEMADMPARDRRAMGARGREWVLKHANCVHMADQVAQTVERLSGGRGRVAGMLRMLAAGVGAARDVATRRPSKAVHKLFGGTRREVICRSFREWLDRAAETPARPPVRRKMPALLSCRDR
ncbi:MAG TPA: glycosyltransferase, partial [Phycisphaerae bacterium]|nr:glycosyltransferase [Phycisphaerae bacterium]